MRYDAKDREIADRILDITDSMQNALEGLINIEHSIRMGHGDSVCAEERMLVEAAARFQKRYQSLVPKILGVKL